ncbi:MAG: hypothetical protein F6K41_40370, partial [Symploca sp. SIO3E6]|nr:hypothetical protein [Caldora sp. SIO3E6]
HARRPDPAEPRSLAPPRGRLRPPSFNTRIKLHQTDDKLLIEIPNIIINFWTLVLLGLIVIGPMLFIGPLFFPLMVQDILFIAVIFLFFGLYIYWESLPTFVEFSAGKFSIYTILFEKKIHSDRGSISKINDVFHTEKTFRSGKNTYTQRVVILQTSDYEYYFGNGLNWQECNWLVNVIQYWLNLG